MEDNSRTPVWVPLAGFVMSAVPLIIMIWTAWTLPDRYTYMWEIQYDQFYYAANARSLIHDGHGLLHANAYDDRPDAPRIYSHLYPSILAGVAGILGMEPIHAVFWVRPIFGVCLSLSIWYFLGSVFFDRRWKSWAFGFLMTSGGVAGLLAMIQTLAVAVGGNSDWAWVFVKNFFENEGVAGDWLCSIARVFLITPELLYHALWFLALGALLRGKRLLATTALALELYAHPFTGLALGLVMAAAAGLELAFDRRNRESLIHAAVVAILGSVFAAYYVWLGRDPGHRLLQEHWEHFKAAIPLCQYPVIYGVWLGLGLLSIPILRAGLWSNPAARLLAIQALTVFLLSNHHLFLKREVQPAHFSRGHLFAALVGLSFMGLESVARARNWEFFGKRGSRILAGILVLLSLDTVLYYAHTKVRAADPPQAILKDQAEALHVIAELPGRQFVASDADIGHLLPVFSKHRVLLGHVRLTPNQSEKWVLWKNWLLTGDERIFVRFPDISVLAIPSDMTGWNKNEEEFQARWSLLLKNPTYLIYQKRETAAPTN